MHQPVTTPSAELSDGAARVASPLTRRQALGLGLAVAGGLQAGGAWGQSGPMVRIGVTKIVSHAALDADEKGFEAGLASSGYKEGVNVTYLRRNAQGSLSQADAIAREFIEAKVDLVHAIATPTAQAVMRSGSRIPLVFSSVTDPVRAGLVPPNSAPGQRTGTHVTGLSDLWPVHLQMQTYAKALPKAKVWGTVYNPAESNSLTHLQSMRESAKELGLTLLEATVTRSDQVGAVAQALVGKVHAITITSDNTVVANLEALVRACDAAKVPLFAGDIDSVARGAVLAYGLDYFLVGYSAGKKAALVLKGIKPGDVPWGPVEKFSLVINRRAAQTQGMVLSPELLALADKLID